VELAFLVVVELQPVINIRLKRRMLIGINIFSLAYPLYKYSYANDARFIVLFKSLLFTQPGILRLDPVALSAGAFTGILDIIRHSPHIASGYDRDTKNVIIHHLFQFL
jgi:hypothetical protein